MPVGDRALTWLERYLEEVRPCLMLRTNEPDLFLTHYGEAFNPDVISRMVTKFIKKADISTHPGVKQMSGGMAGWSRLRVGSYRAISCR